MTLAPVTQFDDCVIAGLPLEGFNCGAASGAMLVAFATGNVHTPTACEFRRQVRNPIGSPDLQGGTRPSQLVDAARRGWGVSLDLQNMDVDDAIALSDRKDRSLAWSVIYRPVSGTPFDGCPGFVGAHEIVRTAALEYDTLADGRRHGIPQAPQNWPNAMLRSAAGLYAGSGRAVVIVAEAPKVKPPRYSVRFTPGNFWTWRIVAGVLQPHKEDDALSFSKATSAPCSAPDTFPLASGVRRRLVKVSKGALAGKWVEPGSPHVSLVVS